MARTLNAVPAATSNFNRADAFYNREVKMADGTWAKVFGAPLSANKQIHKMLMDNVDKLHLMEFRDNIHLVTDKADVGLSFKEEALDPTTLALKAAING